MEKEMLKINLMTIAGSGFLLLLSGILLYLFRERVSPFLRFFLPLGPLSIASYVFVFNLFKHYNGNLPEKTESIARELFFSTLVASVTFGFFTASLVLGIHFLKKYL